ncbi:hypothetical protein SLS64_012766 [Diaporthe eres]
MGFLDNCRPNERFGAHGVWKHAAGGGPTIWFCVDWDRRRHISIRVCEEVRMNDDGSGCEDVMERIYQGLSEVVDGLDDDVNLVNFSIDGNLISTSSDNRHDDAIIPLYCPIDMIPEAYRTREHVVSRDELVEVDRLSPCVDLVTYRSKPRSKGLFKYAFSHNEVHNEKHSEVLRNWHELNYWLRLTSEGHPSIVPVERVVTDGQDVLGHRNNVQVVVGFTSVFFPGMTLQDLQTTPSWIFKRAYLDQLFDVVNDLHLIRGIVHRDIAPRNLLINPETGELQIFNFSCAERMPVSGDFENVLIDFVGVITTVYEIVTGDTQLAEQARLDEDISTIMDKGWTRSPSLRLDGEVSDYQDTIYDWFDNRSEPEDFDSLYTQPLSPLDWPQFWKPEITKLDRHGKKDGKENSSCMWRNALRDWRLKFVEWKRPAQNNIPDGSRVLGDGTLIAQRDLE